MLSDRLSMLNERGKSLLYDHLKPQDVAAVPLDFGNSEVAGLWYTDAGEEQSLLMINHADEEAVCSFSFEEYGIAVPKQVQSDKQGNYENGIFCIKLHRHESVVLRWKGRAQ